MTIFLDVWIASNIRSGNIAMLKAFAQMPTVFGIVAGYKSERLCEVVLHISENYVFLLGTFFLKDRQTLGDRSVNKLLRNFGKVKN